MALLRRFSWAFGAVGFGSLLGFATLWLLYDRVTGAGWVSGLGGLLLVVVYGALEREQLVALVRTRGVSYRLGSMMVLVVALVLAVALERVANQYDARWDLTQDGRFSLSSQTESVLSGLESDIEIFGVFRPSAESDRFRRLAEGYQQFSSHIAYSSLDPLRHAGKVRAITKAEGEREFERISEYGLVIVKSGNQRQRLEGTFDEAHLTDAIVRLTSGEAHRVCWSMGHGERDPDDGVGGMGAGVLATRLKDQNYTVETVRVLAAGIDAECEVLIIARPETDWLPAEREALAAYLAQGGKVFLLLDPTVEGMNAPGLVKEMERYGVVVGDDLVIEANPENQALIQEDEPLSIYYDANFGAHPVVGAISSVVGFELARSVQPIPGDPQGLVVRKMITASEFSWAETNLDINANAMPEPGPEDIVGSVGLMVSVEIADPVQLDVVAHEGPVDPGVEASGEPGESTANDIAWEGRMDAMENRLVPTDLKLEAGGRLIVIGDSDFASNRLSPVLANGDLFLNAVAWLVGEEDQLGDRAPGESELLVISGVQQMLLLLIAMVGMPGLCVVLALWMVIRRRFQ